VHVGTLMISERPRRRIRDKQHRRGEGSLEQVAVELVERCVEGLHELLPGVVDHLPRGLVGRAYVHGGPACFALRAVRLGHAGRTNARRIYSRQLAH
jgi:hypothetical protein